MNGSKENKFVTRVNAGGQTMRVPVGIIHGAQPGQQVTLYAGQHGTEYAAIDAVHRFYRETDPSDVCGTVVCALVANEKSLLNWIQFAPTTPEILDMMKELAQGSQYLINCHSGESSEAICPYLVCHLLGSRELDARALAIARAFGVPHIGIANYHGEPAPSEEPPPNSSGLRPALWPWPSKCIADEMRIPEITPFAGQEGFGGAQAMLGGIRNSLRSVGVLKGEISVPAQRPQILARSHWLIAVETGLFFAEVQIGDEVKKGQLLGTVCNYFGDVLQEAFAPADAKIMQLNTALPVSKDAFLMWLAEIEPDSDPLAVA